MSRRIEIYVLVGLLVALAAAGYYYVSGPSTSAGRPSGFTADANFQPLDIQEPQLRLDLLARVRELQYSGSHRNIFVVAPPPPPPAAVAKPGPTVPPPPPPLVVPAEFFGYASQPHGPRRVAFFTSGDDVLVVAEGDTFLGRFRLNRIGNDSADVEEISSGRHTSMPMVQPPPETAGQ
jgi:hypothetical protein